MTCQFVWDPSLETGDAAIDDDHRHIYALANQFVDALRHDRGVEVLNQTLDALKSHAESHFRREEQEMTELRFPETELHLRHHDQMLFMLHTFLTRKSAADTAEICQQLAEDALRFLDDWIHLHVEHFDRRFVTFVRNGCPALPEDLPGEP